jgi:hypothetical protein
MRLPLALIISLFAGSALAIEINTNSLAGGAPVTTGAIMQTAKVMAFMPQTEVSFAHAPILTDAEIAKLIVPGASLATEAPAVMKAARAAVN